MRERACLTSLDPCRVKHQAGQGSVSVRSVTTFSTAFKGTPPARQAGPGPAKPGTRGDTRSPGRWMTGEWPCRELAGSAGDWPSPGRTACRALPGGSPTGAAPPPVGCPGYP